MNFGRVLFLQGASSAGKSTLTTALQRGLDEYWWALEADDITRMQPTGERTGWWEPTAQERPHPSWDPNARLSRWLAGYSGCLATVARTGSNAIAVGGWLETSWLLELAVTLEGINALCVGVDALWRNWSGANECAAIGGLAMPAPNMNWSTRMRLMTFM